MEIAGGLWKEHKQKVYLSYRSVIHVSKKKKIKLKLQR